MENQPIKPAHDEDASQQPWQGQWPGTGPAPTEGTREMVEEQMAEGKWSESRQRADWTGANQEEAPDEGRAREEGRREGMSDIADQVERGTEAPG